MIHLAETPVDPARVVVLGKNGFVAGAALAALRTAGIATLAVGQDDLDLTDPTMAGRLAGMLRPDDTVLFVAARVPCKTVAGFAQNLAMAETVALALATQPVAHLVAISSDAVYGDKPGPIREADPPNPGSLHGVMHAAREGLLRFGLPSVPLMILRPSLLYGVRDPHGGYGPNGFRRAALAGEPITLFGGGEEQRDHVHIDDLAALIVRVIRHRSTGILTVASGQSLSFRAVADLIAGAAPGPVSVVETPRRTPITHRHFDPTLCLRAFPDFRYRTLADAVPSLVGTGS